MVEVRIGSGHVLGGRRCVGRASGSASNYLKIVAREPRLPGPPKVEEYFFFSSHATSRSNAIDSLIERKSILARSYLQVSLACWQPFCGMPLGMAALRPVFAEEE